MSPGRKPGREARVERAIELYNQGVSHEAIAAELDVHVNTAHIYTRAYRARLQRQQQMQGFRA